MYFSLSFDDYLQNYYFKCIETYAQQDLKQKQQVNFKINSRL